MLEGKKLNIKIGGDFEPIPMDKYTVQIADVNLKSQFNKFKGVEEEMLNFQYVILDKKAMPDSSETTWGRYLWHRMSQALSTKSWLLKLAKAVYGRELTREEMEKFDPEALVGLQVDVMVDQKPNADGTAIYNNIVAYSKNVKQLEPFINGSPAKQVVVEKATVPVGDANTIFDGKLDSDPFINELEEEEKAAKTPKLKKDELSAEELAEQGCVWERTY